MTHTEEGERFEKKLHNVTVLLDKLETRRLKLLQSLEKPDLPFQQLDPSSYIAVLRKKYVQGGQ